MQTELKRRFGRLEQLREAWLASLAVHGNGVLNQSPAAGGWSVAQVICHLILAEQLSLDSIRRKSLAGNSMARAGLGSALKSMVLKAVLRSPMRFKAPRPAGEVPEAEDLDSVTARWQQLRSEWGETLAAFPEDLLDRAVYAHPFAGPLSLPQALDFIEEHFRHHVRQVERILKEIV
jgi:hypothetical protein